MEPLKRKRGLGPTQAKVLDALRAMPKGGDRQALEEASGLTRAQVRSALRGLERRELVIWTAEEEHVTAARWWTATPVEEGAGPLSGRCRLDGPGR
jgi:DNA-binding MarR family transcriptional regulator